MTLASPPELIIRKREGGKLSDDEIRGWIDAYVRGDIPDYQMAAMAMAIFFQGMTPQETAALTMAMRDSGQVIDLDGIDAIKVDKHSTGGVGDKVSLCLAPIVAACGVPVPMVAGRGLGHTGGTLDKLEAIPGFDVGLSIERYREVLAEVGTVEAAKRAADEGIDVEVIDLRTLWPLDVETVVASAKKTGRIVVVHEAPRTCGLGAEISSLIQERAFLHLEAPVKRCAGFDTPFPYTLEMEYLPLQHRITPALLETVKYVP